MTRKACALTLSALMVATVLLCAAPTGVAAAGSAGTPQSIYKAWGYDGFGQLGNRSNTDSNTPVIVSGLTGMVAVSGGGYHSLALMSDRTVWTWGWNLYGQLGDGTNNDSNAPAAIPGLSGVAAVSGGYYHSLALGSDGTVQSQRPRPARRWYQQRQ